MPFPASSFISPISLQETQEEVQFVAAHASGAYTATVSFNDKSGAFRSKSGKYKLVRQPQPDMRYALDDDSPLPFFLFSSLYLGPGSG